MIPGSPAVLKSFRFHPLNNVMCSAFSEKSPAIHLEELKLVEQCFPVWFSSAKLGILKNKLLCCHTVYYLPLLLQKVNKTKTQRICMLFRRELLKTALKLSHGNIQVRRLKNRSLYIYYLVNKKIKLLVLTNCHFCKNRFIQFDSFPHNQHKCRQV